MIKFLASFYQKVRFIVIPFVYMENNLASFKNAVLISLRELVGKISRVLKRQILPEHI